MRLAGGVIVVLFVMIAAAFCFVDSGTALVLSFALVAVVFFGSLPWVIMSALDRRKSGTDNTGARVVRGFDDDRIA